MAVLELTSDPSRISLVVRGEVGRQTVDEMRATLVRVEAARPADAPAGTAVEVDLRQVTAFSRLGIAVLISAHRWFGDRLRIRGNDEVLTQLDDAGLTRVLKVAA
jgi:anti-anti-sigma regulatory factor